MSAPASPSKSAAGAPFAAWHETHWATSLQRHTLELLFLSSKQPQLSRRVTVFQLKLARPSDLGGAVTQTTMSTPEHGH
jgi:hypothetical protein